MCPSFLFYSLWSSSSDPHRFTNPPDTRITLLAKDEGAHFVSHIFDSFLTGSTPSTVGVRPTGKKMDRSTSSLNCQFVSLIFDFVLMNFHFIHTYKPDEYIQGYLY